MIKQAFEYLIGLAKIDKTEISGRNFTLQDVNEIKPLQISPIKIHTLQGVVDFFKGEDGLSIDIEPKDAMIQIVDPCTVRVYSAKATDVHRQRECFLEATRINQDFQFDSWYNQEQMVIKLMTMFNKSESMEEVIKVVSGLVASASVTVNDDGLGQDVTVRKGVSRVEQVEIKNPIMLEPIRTFTEVDQVSAPHVLRVRCVREELEIAIFEAGGGQWKNEAITKIKEWLREEIGEDVKILG